MAAATLVKATQELRIEGQKPIFAQFEGAANALDNSGVQDIFTLNVEGLSRIAIKLTVATNALAAFVIQASFDGLDATFNTIKSTAGEFTSPTGVLIDSSGDLTAQAVGTGWFVLDVAGFKVVKLQANSSGASSTLAISGGGV